MPDPATPSKPSSPSEATGRVRTDDESLHDQKSHNGVQHDTEQVRQNADSEVTGSKVPHSKATDTPGHKKTRESIFSLHSLMVNLVLPLILLVGAFLVFLLLGSVEPEKRTAIDNTRLGRMKALAPVRIEQLQSLKATGTQLALEIDGTVVPFQEAKVAAEVAGRVTMKSEKCEAGQYVQQGDLLMKIDNTDYKIEVERLTRQKEQEYQSLREIDQEMANAQRVIKITEDDVKLQMKEVKRQSSLPKGYASRGDIEKAQRSLNAAQQQLISAENNLNLLRQRRVRLEASEQLAATNLRAAEVNLARTEIRAPIEGVIVSEEADVNTFVSRGQMLVVIDDTSKAEVASSMRMDQLYWVLDQGAEKVNGISPKMSRSYDLPETPALIEYQISGRENTVYRWKARLLSYNGIGLDNDTRTVPVRIVVDDPQTMVDENGKPVEVSRTNQAAASALVRGMYVRVKLLITPQTPLVVIPARAIRPGNRVFEFVHDESVLTPKEQPTGNDEVVVAEDETEQTDETDETGEKEIETFDPDDWQAGRVVSRNSVTPINSMIVLNKNSNGDAGPDQGEEKLWVCEVGNRSVGPDSWVVVSPIGTVDGDYLPARASVVKPKETPTGETEADKNAEVATLGEVSS
ncbi:multidrug resistance protein MdtN [Rubripirellula obstinata]|uniref:Multidrug resistance protein MdtN n=1 Tax=Rubripirellula obstinata TaxID=406547 RepID=A0A5B1C8Z6_9BACT|nr:biotin/lipoyl-binding protein [Rubripirellula obstinata]KAA1257597.1 multidrug resistance protein MdtN [Rubripirellula obstinata]